MLARVIRSRVVESVHDGVVAVVDPNGEMIASSGDVHRTFFARSSIKPIQAQVVLESGANLPPEWLAVACSSHAGAPVHIATIDAMLEDVGLSRTDLQTPPGWPSPQHRDRLIRVSRAEPQPIYHNCSGKHAGFLVACQAAGWATESYRDETHPLQVRIQELLAEVSGSERFDLGVDGCGAPTFAMSAVALARAFNRVGNDARFDRVFEAMHRFPRLASGVGKPDAEIAVHINGVAKRGAEGNLAITIPGRGAMAIKIFDGADRPVGPVAVDALTQLGWVTPSMSEGLRASTRQPMFGGGREVGTLESVLELATA